MHIFAYVFNIAQNNLPTKNLSSDLIFKYGAVMHVLLKPQAVSCKMSERDKLKTGVIIEKSVLAIF